MNTLREKNWREIPIGARVLEPGSSIANETGAWRSVRPVRDPEKCVVRCLLCWIYCPDGAVETGEGMMKSIDLKYCKGCGICARECPRGAIEMIEETKAREMESAPRGSELKFKEMNSATAMTFQIQEG